MDHSLLTWSVGKHLEDAFEWIREKELKIITQQENQSKNFITLNQERELLWEEEKRRQRIINENNADSIYESYKQNNFK